MNTRTPITPCHNVHEIAQGGKTERIHGWDMTVEVPTIVGNFPISTGSSRTFPSAWGNSPTQNISTPPSWLMAWVRVDPDACTPAARATVEEAMELAADWICERRHHAVGVFEVQDGAPVTLGWVCLGLATPESMNIVWLPVSEASKVVRLASRTPI
jgi:hypothetical protein